MWLGKAVVVAALALGAAQAAATTPDIGPAPVCSAASQDIAMGSFLRPVRQMARPTSWFRFGGQKLRGPQLERSEAGVTLSLFPSVAVQLHYERTARSPLMRGDHDDGVLTRLRLRF